MEGSPPSAPPASDRRHPEAGRDANSGHIMEIPTLQQLERALHLRGAMETARQELSDLLGGLARVVAPEPEKRSRRKSKPPFASERPPTPKPKKTRSRRKTTGAGPVETPGTVAGAKTSRASRTRKARTRAAAKARLRDVVTGGTSGSAPVAIEAKSHGKKSPARRSRRASKARRKRS